MSCDFLVDWSPVTDVVLRVVRSEQVVAVEQVLKDYGTGTARKMRKLALQKLSESSTDPETSVKNSVKSKKLKHVVDKMLFNYRNIGR